jgi:hypothetical protein
MYVGELTAHYMEQHLGHPLQHKGETSTEHAMHARHIKGHLARLASKDSAAAPRTVPPSACFLLIDAASETFHTQSCSAPGAAYEHTVSKLPGTSHASFMLYFALLFILSFVSWLLQRFEVWRSHWSSPHFSTLAHFTFADPPHFEHCNVPGSEGVVKKSYVLGTIVFARRGLVPFSDKAKCAQVGTLIVKLSPVWHNLPSFPLCLTFRNWGRWR